MTPADVPATQRLLLDTNVLIYFEDYPKDGSEKGAAAVAALETAAALGYVPFLAQASVNELRQSGTRSQTRVNQAMRYQTMSADNPLALAQQAGYTFPISSNDLVDLELISIIKEEKAAWLTTEDQVLIHHAWQAGVPYVLSLDGLISLLAPALEDQEPPLGVTEATAADINLNSTFFQSLRLAYPEFLTWWNTKVVPQDRDVLIIGEADDPAGLVVLKENDADYGLPRGTAKICTFKIANHARGQHYGELLLEATIRKLRHLAAPTCFVEVADQQTELITFLKSFGFYHHQGRRAANNDMVFVKDLHPLTNRSISDPWAFHKRYGPGKLKVKRAHLVPIQPHWHDKLFPTPGNALFYMPEPCGNAIKKIYMCHASTRKIKRGDTLIFVESKTQNSISNIGVVEDVLISSDPLVITKFCGTRTVYSPQEIRELTAHPRQVLVIKFRHDRKLDRPWGWHKDGYNALIQQQAIQTIQQVKPEGVTWIRENLDA